MTLLEGAYSPPLRSGRVVSRSADKQAPPQGAVFAHQYRPDIDGLRAIAVSAVITYHFYSQALPGGFLGVDMFFVISGYVITASLAQQEHGSAQSFFLSFYSRRVKRILPALVICVLLTCLIGGLFINPKSDAYSSSMTAGIFSLFGLSNIYFSRQATDYFSSATQLNLFTHTWSLGVEEQFYLVFPALFWISSLGRPSGRRFLLLGLTLLTALSFLSYLWLNRGIPGAAYFMMPPRFWELGVGCLIAVGASKALSSDPYRFRHAPWFALLLVAIALLTPADRQLYTTPAIVVGTALMIATLRPGVLLHRLLTLRYLLSVGLMSYSLYLWHWSVLSISRWTLGIHWWSVPILLATILGLATSSYVFVENPLRRAQWSSSKLVTIGLGLVALIFSAGVMFLLKRSDVLYTGTPTRFEGIGIGTILDKKRDKHNLEWPAGACVLFSDTQVGKMINADACTLGAPFGSKRRFLVAGSSFAAAEFEMYSVLAENGLGAVVATASLGASALPEISNTGPFAKENEYYWRDVLPTLFSQLKEGDVVILLNDLAGFAPAETNRFTIDAVAQLRAGLEHLVKELGQRGIQVIFQSANPFMREAQCTPEMASPQWFNIGTAPPCTYYTKTESLKRRQPLQDALEALQSTNPNFHILDLFPVLCPDNTCKFYNDQKVFLYRDESSHMSIAANYMARPVLLAAVDRAIRASDKTLHVRNNSN
jgi:peptidoglycan/LPS O-acetylase OafA/YrhL